jgi:type VI secretion system protein ImpF
MARVDSKQGLMASILDRLVDPATAGADGQHGYTIGQMMEAVRKDLEELLNTRQTLDGPARSRQRVRHSIVGYGLPDFTSVPVTTPQQRADIARALEATVIRYEPRLRDVRVVPLESEAAKQTMLRFRIEARLTVEPGPEVAFDTFTEETGQYSVTQSSQTSDSFSP